MYDVIICGCGSAGFCAAVAAARQGLRTAVVERYGTPGGILTVLGNNSIDQFNNPWLPGNKMVIRGIGWEYVLRLKRDGFAFVPDMDDPPERTGENTYVHWKYGVKVNPVAAAKVMDDMLLESGVTLFYGQPMVEVKTSGNRITGVVIAGREGLRTLEGKLFLDCTGDGELAAFAGAEFLAGDGTGIFQPGTLRFYPAVNAPEDNILNYGDNKNHVSLNTTNSDSQTLSEIEGRRMLYDEMLRGNRIMACAPAVAPREGRRIAGLAEMRVEDYKAGTVFSDAVCYSYWFVDVHRDGEPAKIEYLCHENTPTIPLSAMIAKDFTNLLMAGRCISTDRDTNSAIRVKASCMAMGEAAGAAAAEILKSGADAHHAPVEKIRQLLHRTGAVVPGLTSPVGFREAMKGENA